jgi:hypothetical protein
MTHKQALNFFHIVKGLEFAMGNRQLGIDNWQKIKRTITISYCLLAIAN